MLTTFTIRLMLCVGLAAVLSETLPLPRSYWVVLAVAVVVKPDFGSVFARAVQYGAGTIVGAAVAALILAAHPPAAVLLALMIVLAALLPYAMSRNYALYGIAFTPLVILLIELISPGGWRIADDRLIDILLGCAMALAVGYLPWPSRWHAHLPRDLAAAVDDAGRYLEEALSQQRPDVGAVVHARVRRRLAALRIEFQRIQAEPNGVRRQVTVWLPAVAALERLIEAVTAQKVMAEGQPLPREELDRLASSLRSLAAAVRSGIPVERHPPSRGTPPPLHPVDDAVHELHTVLSDLLGYCGAS
jgi:uncharacterized membrane protein YccC